MSKLINQKENKMNVTDIKNAMMTMTQTELSQIMNIAQQIKAIRVVFPGW